MALQSDLAFSAMLAKHEVLPAGTLEDALQVVDSVLALGLRVPLARVLRERGIIDPAATKTILDLPMNDKKRALLAEQIRWLTQSPPQEEPRIPEAALQAGLISIQDSAEVRALQGKVKSIGFDKRPLEILIETRRLLPEVAVALFDHLRAPDAAVFSRADLVFCTVAASSRAAPPKDLQAAIAVQRKLCARTRLGRPVGEILLALGKLQPEPLQTLVDLVRAQCPEEPAHRILPLSTSREQDRQIAELVQLGWIPLDQVDESRRVLGVMQELGLQRKLGEVIAARGVAPLDRLEALVAAAKARPDAPPALPPGTVALDALAEDLESRETAAIRGGAVLEGDLPPDGMPMESEPVLMEPLPDEVLEADPPEEDSRSGAPRRPVSARRRRPRRHR